MQGQIEAGENQYRSDSRRKSDRPTDGRGQRSWDLPLISQAFSQRFLETIRETEPGISRGSAKLIADRTIKPDEGLTMREDEDRCWKISNQGDKTFQAVQDDPFSL